jgi:hypothetical protein
VKQALNAIRKKMRILPFLLLLFASTIDAKEIKTDSFTLDLPENYKVETDKKSRLLAFGGNGPYDLPFLSIEFGKRVKPSSVIKRVNGSIKQGGFKLLVQQLV